MPAVIKVILIILASLLAIAVLGAAYLLVKCLGKTKNTVRLDSDGFLYYTEYTGNYYNWFYRTFMARTRGTGCSAFITRTENGDVIMPRNMDYPHLDDKNELTGLNVVVRLSPKGKYASVNVADAYWLSTLGVPYYRGALDNGTTKLPMALIPYMCLDGVNEKGLSAAILALDVKNGGKAVEQDVKGRYTLGITELLRYMIDSCATVGEAVALAGRYNMWNTYGEDYHIFVTDAGGKSAVLEWVDNELTVTYQDAVTNFYVSKDDADDCYLNGELYERFEGRSGTEYGYHWGYGHGYRRFGTIVGALDRHRLDAASYDTVMKEDESIAILDSVVQKYDGTSRTSHTQYSVVYNNTKRSARVFSMGDFSHGFDFSVQ